MSARFWEFQHLTDSFGGTSSFDQVPRAGRLYIGGVSALYKEPDPLKQVGITHIFSAIDFDLEDLKPLKDYKQLLIQADDVPDEDLLRHFRKTNKFIHDALSNGGAVFVHCAMGVSRSATLVIAYLMWKHRLPLSGALAQLREGRPRVHPNPGFTKQLEVYAKILEEDGQDWDEKMYQHWKRDGYTVKLAGKGSRL